MCMEARHSFHRLCCRDLSDRPQLANQESEDETNHSFDRHLYPIVQNHFLFGKSRSTKEVGYLYMREREKRFKHVDAARLVPGFKSVGGAFSFLATQKSAVRQHISCQTTIEGCLLNGLFHVTVEKSAQQQNIFTPPVKGKDEACLNELRTKSPPPPCSSSTVFGISWGHKRIFFCRHITHIQKRSTRSISSVMCKNGVNRFFQPNVQEKLKKNLKEEEEERELWHISVRRR